MRLLLIEDECHVLHALERMFRQCPIPMPGGPVYAKVDSFMSPRMALSHALHHPFDLVISDYRMAELDGVSVLRQMLQLQPGCARVILSGYADLEAMVAAINVARIDQFVAKPWADADLLSVLAQVLQRRAERLESEALADRQRRQQGQISAQELERRRLEREEPGITRVEFEADGSVRMPELSLDLLLDLDPGHELVPVPGDGAGAGSAA